MTHAFSAAGEESGYTNDVTFQFAPPHGTKCTEEEVRTVETYSPSGVVRPEIHEQRFSSKWRVQRTKDEVLFIARNTSLSSTINGAPFKNPAGPVLKNLITTNSISLEGKHLRSTYSKDVTGELRKRLPNPLPPGMESQMSNAILEQRQKLRWEVMTESLIGRTVRQSQAWEKEVGSSGSGEMHAFEKVVVVSPSPPRLLVSMLSLSCSDAGILKRFPLETASSLEAPVINEFLSWIATGKPLTKACIRRIVDANTMLPVFEEHIVQKVSFRNAQPVIRTERSKRRFDYEG